MHACAVIVRCHGYDACPRLVCALSPALSLRTKTAFAHQASRHRADHRRREHTPDHAFGRGSRGINDRSVVVLAIGLALLASTIGAAWSIWSKVKWTGVYAVGIFLLLALGGHCYRKLNQTRSD